MARLRFASDRPRAIFGFRKLSEVLAELMFQEAEIPPPELLRLLETAHGLVMGDQVRCDSRRGP